MTFKDELNLVSYGEVRLCVVVVVVEESLSVKFYDLTCSLDFSFCH